MKDHEDITHTLLCGTEDAIVTLKDLPAGEGLGSKSGEASESTSICSSPKPLETGPQKASGEIFEQDRNLLPVHALENVSNHRHNTIEFTTSPSPSHHSIMLTLLAWLL
jgi:hypothetical protein